MTRFQTIISSSRDSVVPHLLPHQMKLYDDTQHFAVDYEVIMGETCVQKPARTVGIGTVYLGPSEQVGKLESFLMRFHAIFERQMINLDTFYKVDMRLSIFCRKR